ncbi:MAG: FAD-dependent oxidoreductase [Candidatus Nealsonbacteria bacterium]|nr:FAD-dependent oxidoreductase [Candidatus Nealsonbacteria bacterium]
MYDLIIIGGGPAGMTAGIYAARQKLKILLITEGFGGQMAKKSIDVENYPGFIKISGFDLIKSFENHLKSKEVEIKMAKIKSLKKGKDCFLVSIEGEEFKAKAVIVASGAEPRMLNVKGEKEFIGKGVSYCPICDGPLFREKDVAIVGGGEAGCEAGIFLVNYVKKIYVLDSGSEITASKAVHDVLKESGKAEFISNAKIKEIKGDKFVSSIIYEGKESEKELKVSAVFVEIGYQPATSFIEEGLVNFTPKGEIEVDLNTQETKEPGIFAAGDVSGGKCKQIVVAAAEGAKAALAVSKYLKNAH